MKGIRLLAAATVGIAVGVSVFAQATGDPAAQPQNPPRYEAASVKPNRAGGMLVSVSTNAGRAARVRHDAGAGTPQLGWMTMVRLAEMLSGNLGRLVVDTVIDRLERPTGD